MRMVSNPGRRLAGIATLALLAAPRLGRTDTAWPSRPLRLIVGYPAGGSTDVCARILAEDFRTRLPQPVVVENRTGANGSVGAAYVAAATDGHTMLVSNTSTMTVNHLIYRDTRYDPLRDLLPVATITISPFILATATNNARMRGANTLADLVALARRQPGVLTYSSGGIGNLQHLGMEALCTQIGIRLLHVPYRGAAPAETALFAGEVDLLLQTPTSVPLFQAGTLRGIACTGTTRWRELPEVPTIAESGLGDFVSTFWNGLVAPANTPPPVVEQLLGLMRQAAEAPDSRRLLLGQGDVMVLEPEAFRARIALDIARNAEVIQATGIERQ